ncbi:5-(carboxyamino)imidazole ribonucleotide synthase [soil metagenome]
MIEGDILTAPGEFGTHQAHSRDPLPRAMVGIVGAGQLARMTLQAAIPLDVSIRLLAERANDGAALIWRDVIFGAATDNAALTLLAATTDVVTFDHELVPVPVLERLESEGYALRPSPATMALAQNKQRQREMHAALGLPVPAFRVTDDPADAFAFAEELGWPIVAKSASGGYDGRGVWVLRDPESAHRFAAEIAERPTTIVLEEFVPIERELAILVARRPNGEQVVYPLVETIQIDGICHEIIAPARVSPALEAEAIEIAHRVADAAGVTGVMALELFESGGRLLINEIATRPHNSGHYTIEGTVTSQFEQHLRAVLDWPLGTAKLNARFVVTVNILGPRDGSDPATRRVDALSVPGVHIHFYGKEARPGRKLGHVTALGDDLDDVRNRAWQAATLLTGEERTTR